MRNRTRKAMDYITNLFPCITFIPAEVESPNYVTIYPGTYIPYTRITIYPGTKKNLPRHQNENYPGTKINLPRNQVRK